ncbi:MAG: hypothetical protein IJY58_03615 [Alphaproteobacteria bacterium]|nr:hypothetical protein [Alphaproteobacteria bacterium]
MEILNAFLNGYFKQKNAETGRSMVEMLGVLAVIGVLSIGGIYGYTFAMDKYRANDIVYEVNLRANDVWHKYQEQPLPDPSEDGTDFDEFPDTTGTGYPIYMTSHPDVAFKTYVEGVSSRVCKNVVNMNLNGVIQGIQFVQVAQGDGDLVKYTGSASICGEEETDNTLVFTSFLDSESNEGEGQSGDPCVEEEDCNMLCAPVTCEDDMTCHNSCTGTSTPFCYDNDSGGICVECLSNKDCPNEQICDLTKHECVALPESCGEGDRYGKEYRAANGSCVSCDYMSEIIIMNSDDNDGIFEKQVGSVSIKDTHSGIEMCQACASIQHRIEEAGTGDNIKTYCATGCIKGNSFLSKTSGCIPCNSLTEIAIPNEDQARLQCTACTNRVWFRENTSPSADYICVLRTCPDGYFKNHTGKCRKCVINGWPSDQDFYNAIIWFSYLGTSAGNLAEEWSEGCLQCANATDPKLRKKYQVVKQGSSYVCTDVCGPNQFQDSAGNCYDCNTEEAPGLGTFSGWVSGMKSWLVNLCTSCTTAKREVQDGKCVKVGDSDCSSEPVPSFMGTDYTCYPCTHNARVQVFTDANKDGVDDYGGCTSVCGEDKRFMLNGYCYKKCDANQVMSVWGACQDCSKIGLSYKIGEGSNPPIVDELCRTACGKGTHDVYSCDYIYCAPTDCGEGRLHTLLNDYNGPCDKCPTASSKSINVRSDNATFKAECEACGNHAFINQYCVYMNPSQSGICNSDSPDTTKWSNYTAGIGVLYRDNTGVCRRCDDQSNSYASTQTECESCIVNGVQIRRWVGGSCVYGGCSEGDTFRTANGCTSCTTNAIKVATTGQDADLLCNACHRRIMTDVNEIKYCVQKCDSDEWQDINGDCWGAETDVGSNEIGTDELSAQLCRNVSRTPNKDTATGKVYCQQ